MNDLEARIRVLEQSNRRQRRTLIGTAMFLGAAMTMSASSISSYGAVYATDYWLVDAKGTVIGNLGPDQGGKAGLWLGGTKPKHRALAVDKAGNVSLRTSSVEVSRDGVPFAQLGITSDGSPALQFHDGVLWKTMSTLNRSWGQYYSHSCEEVSDIPSIDLSDIFER